ncbi:MAG: hypothetical protein LBJ93_01680 [Clostridiales bacterium]|jgi:hypothetical protein|nr:hypothetical protein [Clostridiales bacterium]
MEGDILIIHQRLINVFLSDNVVDIANFVLQQSKLESNPELDTIINLFGRQNESGIEFRLPCKELIKSNLINNVGITNESILIFLTLVLYGVANASIILYRMAYDASFMRNDGDFDRRYTLFKSCVDVFTDFYSLTNFYSLCESDKLSSIKTYLARTEINFNADKFKEIFVISNRDYSRPYLLANLSFCTLSIQDTCSLFQTLFDEIEDNEDIFTNIVELLSPLQINVLTLDLEMESLLFNIQDPEGFLTVSPVKRTETQLQRLFKIFKLLNRKMLVDSTRISRLNESENLNIENEEVIYEERNSEKDIEDRTSESAFLHTEITNSKTKLETRTLKEQRKISRKDKVIILLSSLATVIGGSTIIILATIEKLKYSINYLNFTALITGASFLFLFLCAITAFIVHNKCFRKSYKCKTKN